MTKFKVGDKVTIDNYPEEGVQTIIKIDPTHYYCYDFDKGGSWEDEGLTLYEESGYSYDPVSKPSHYNQDGGIKSNGGPSKYYDFEPDWATWNDFADYKATNQWKEHSFHLGNVGKVLCRWGDKEGTTKDYDARKIVYSGLRTLLMLEGKDSVREYLNSLLEDNQFKTQGDDK